VLHMNAYSKDLRVKVLDAVGRGLPRREVAELLGISLSTISRYVKLKASGHRIAPMPSPGRKAKILASPDHRRALWRQLEKNEIATLQEHYEMFESVRERQGVFCVRGDDEPRGAQAGVDFQKRSMASSERDERRRSAFGEYVKSVVAERFVFVEECSTNTSLAAVYATGRQKGGECGAKLPGTGARTSRS
jgi:transposase